MKQGSALVWLCILVVLAATGLQLANRAEANFMVSLPAITIDENGSIYPETEFITKASNVYRLTGSIVAKYVLVIQCSNIVLDGEGYCVNGTAMQGVGYSNVGLTLEGVSNVTVKNLEVCTFSDFSIKLNNCSKCVLYNITVDDLSFGNSTFNKVTESRITEYLALGNNNQLTRSNITGKHVVLISNNLVTENNISSISIYWPTTNNTFFKNNFYCDKNYFVVLNRTFGTTGQWATIGKITTEQTKIMTA